MPGLNISEPGLRDLARNKEYEARAAGADGMDIRLSRDSGFDARDIMNLRAFTRDHDLLIVSRCPKVSARAFHGTLNAKTWATKAKTNATGTVYNASGQLMVSDYDLMSIWRFTGTGFQKIFASALQYGASRGPWSTEARELVKAMNKFLITKIQHGCQDDFLSENNPGVKMADHFIAFRIGDGIHLPTPIYCENYYKAHGLFWPYDARGKHIGHVPGGPIPQS